MSKDLIGLEQGLIHRERQVICRGLRIIELNKSYPKMPHYSPNLWRSTIKSAWDKICVPIYGDRER